MAQAPVTHRRRSAFFGQARGRGRLRSARPGSEGTCREPHSCTPAPPALPRPATTLSPDSLGFSHTGHRLLASQTEFLLSQAFARAASPAWRAQSRSACSFSPRGRVCLLSECLCRSLAVSSVRAGSPATFPHALTQPSTGRWLGGHKPHRVMAEAWIPACGAFFSRVTSVESVIPPGPQFPPLGCLRGLARGHGARTCILTARNRQLGPRRRPCTRGLPRGPSIHYPCVPGRVRDTGIQNAACPPPSLMSSLEPSTL